jgi:hypothetical protein
VETGTSRQVQAVRSTFGDHETGVAGEVMSRCGLGSRGGSTSSLTNRVFTLHRLAVRPIGLTELRQDGVRDSGKPTLAEPQTGHKCRCSKGCRCHEHFNSVADPLAGLRRPAPVCSWMLVGDARRRWSSASTLVAQAVAGCTLCNQSTRISLTCAGRSSCTQCPQPGRRWLPTSPGMVVENESMTFWIHAPEASRALRSPAHSGQGVLVSYAARCASNHSHSTSLGVLYPKAEWSLI